MDIQGTLVRIELFNDKLLNYFDLVVLNYYDVFSNVSFFFSVFFFLHNIFNEVF